jgi:hypothetical protein
MNRMTRPANGDEHVQLQLGLFVLGALSPQEHLAVTEHLARCPQCWQESIELSEVPAFLSLLTPQDVDQLAREFGAESRGGGPTVPTPRTPVADRPASGGRAATGPGRRPHRPRSRTGLTGRARFVVSAVAVALVVGIGVGVWLRGGGPVAITLAGSDTNTVTGVTISVTVTGQAHGSRVDATVKGLRPGVEYQLYVVDVHGQTTIVAHWVAGEGPYTYSGDLAATTDDIAFFTVTQTDGSVVVTVRVAKSDQGQAAASPHGAAEEPALDELIA